MTRDDDWLSLEKPDPKEDFSWLDAQAAKPAAEKPAEKKRRKKKGKRKAARVESGTKLTNELARAPQMGAKSLLGKKRTWASDGEYVYFRRSQANPATLERHEKFLRTGDYQHIATEDDVEIYKLQESSPFYRQNGGNLLEADFISLRRHAVLAACRHDYGLFHDILEEISSRLKGAFHPAEAKGQYDELLTYIFHLINLRGGPSNVAIDRGFQAVRKRRGVGSGRVIALPPRNAGLVLPPGRA